MFLIKYIHPRRNDPFDGSTAPLRLALTTLVGRPSHYDEYGAETAGALNYFSAQWP